MPRPDALPLPHAEVRHVVSDADLASRLSLDPVDRFPGVLATTRMIALMEIASARCLVPLLDEGECSVGVGVDARHTAATPQGGTVIVEARYAGREGKLHRFEVAARDDAGEIGRGTHTRAIVTESRLLDGARRRVPAGP